MAINGRKISSFSKLNSLTGDEYLMVAYKGKSYKIPTSMLLGNIITDLNQVQSDEDGADNPITMEISSGDVMTFHVYNGKKGSQGDKGETGDKGERGNSGIPLYNTNSDTISSLIVNSVDDIGFSDEELTKRMLSAAMGKYLNQQITELKEVYFDTQEEFDQALSEGKIYDDTKYYIFEE